MRRSFQNELARLEGRILDALASAVRTLDTIAGTVGEPAGNASLIAHDATQLRASAHRVHVDLVIVASREAPVASDLRLVMTMVELAHHLILLANQFELINDQLEELDSSLIDRQHNTQRLSGMAQLDAAMLQKAAEAFAERNLTIAHELDTDDEAVDQLNRAVFASTAHAETPAADEREQSLRYMLIARALERIGDNAVDIAEQAAFLVTTKLRQFTDASQPRARRNPPDPTQNHV